MITIKDVYISDDDLRELFEAQALSKLKREREKALDELVKIAQENDMGYTLLYIPIHDILIVNHDTIS